MNTYTPPARPVPATPTGLRFWESRRGAGPYLVLAILTVIFFARILFSPPDQRIGGVDITEYFQWIHQFARAEFLAGRIPLWNSYNYAGIPFAANPQCTVFYPPSWLYMLMPPIHAHKWMIALHVFMAGAFMYTWLRLLGVHRFPATVGCFPWMFGSYVMANAAVGHLTMLFTMAWLPLAMYCYERSFRCDRIRWLFWTGFVLGIQILAGEPQNCYYTALAVAGYGLVRSIFDDTINRPRWHPARYGRWFLGLMMMGTIAALTSGVQFFITMEYMLHSDRAAGNYQFAVNRSFPPPSLLGFIVPWSNDVRSLSFGASTDKLVMVELNWEFACYTGILTLMLAGLSSAIRRNRMLLAVQVLAVFAVLLMLGGYTPLYRLLYEALPGLRLFRIPARAVVILVWAIAVMAAFGLQWSFDPQARNWQATHWRRVAIGAFSLTAIAAVVAIAFLGVAKSVPEGSTWWKSSFTPPSFSEPMFLAPVIVPLVAALLLAILHRLPRSAAAACVATLVIAELWWAVPDFHLKKYSPSSNTQLQRLLDLRAANPEPFRIDAPPQQIPANLALDARVEHINGYWPFALGRFYRFVHWMHGYSCPIRDRYQFNEKIYDPKKPFPLRVMNVRYALPTQPAEDPPRWIENPRVLPRAWLVDRFELIPDEETTLRRMQHPDFDPSRIVLLEKEPGLIAAPSDSPPGTCSTRKLDNGGLDIETSTNKDALLVISEVFYPGWKARIDGDCVPLLRADDVITALRLPAGQHRITLRYEPASFKLGCVTTAACGLTALVLLAARKRSVRTQP